MTESTISPVDSDDFDFHRRLHFWWFVSERQHVWYRRIAESNPPPWTEDPIIRENRFTNVYRRLDPGTQYLIDNVLERDKPRADKLFNTLIYRLIGRKETFGELGFQDLEEFSPVEMERILKRIRDVKKKPVFTGAYTVAGYSQMGTSDKIENVAELFSRVQGQFPDIFEDIVECSHPKEAYETIKSLTGFGNFLSYQVFVDLTYPLGIYDSGSVIPFDQNRWAAAGPGAKRGIGMLLKDEKMVSELDVMKYLFENQEKELDYFGFEIVQPQLGGFQQHLSLPDIQNCLCEYHKYIKIMEGTGKSRRSFDEKAAYLRQTELSSFGEL